MQKHIFLADCSEHIAFKILHPFWHARGKGGPQQIGPLVNHQLLEMHKANHAAHFDNLSVIHAQLVDDLIAQIFGRARADLKAHHFATAAAFEGGFKFTHQIFGFFLNLQIAVAQDAEGAGTCQLIARK